MLLVSHKPQLNPALALEAGRIDWLAFGFRDKRQTANLLIDLVSHTSKRLRLAPSCIESFCPALSGVT